MKDIRVKYSGLAKLADHNKTADGRLFVIEEEKDIPIEIKRVYFLMGFSGDVSERGNHAHKSLEQYIFCIKGSFTLGLDDGENQQTLVMDDPSVGVRLGAKLWHTMSDFSEDCIILVVASDYYDESDYLRDYDEFLAHIRETGKV